MLRFEKRSAHELSRSRVHSDSDFDPVSTISNTNPATDAAADSDTIFTWRSRRSSDSDADSVSTWRARRRPEQVSDTNSNAKEEMAAN